ncbi:hypothetical protein CDAR_543901 [Caerostris darwini]|uniref:Uncharacterized protein n=1 Tax=Caerostris darwini TaxID=1538125 RepID=A0AAV4THG2_9ARAC|nr:hypothetical protein CDAR_543901 [Caerostris darwini]
MLIHVNTPFGTVLPLTPTIKSGSRAAFWTMTPWDLRNRSSDCIRWFRDSHVVRKVSLDFSKFVVRKQKYTLLAMFVIFQCFQPWRVFKFFCENM